MTSSRYVTSGRAALATTVVGSGKPVVFLHASVCDSRMWQAQLDDVGAANLAIAYDRRGFGNTRSEEERFSAVSDLMTVLDAITDGEPAILVGCSQGGRIALDAALRHPARVRALVLVASSVSGAPDARYPPEASRLLAMEAAAKTARDLDRVNAINAHLWLDGPLEREGRVTGKCRQLFLEMNAIALGAAPTGSNIDAGATYDRLRELNVPSLVIWGDRDLPHIQERCQYIASTMPNGLGHVLAGVAHLPPLEQPQEVTRLVSEFISRF